MCVSAMKTAGRFEMRLSDEENDTFQQSPSVHRMLGQERSNGTKLAGVDEFGFVHGVASRSESVHALFKCTISNR